jgi:hypothetical protein
MLHRVRITMLHKMLREAPTLGSNIDPPLDDLHASLFCPSSVHEFIELYTPTPSSPSLK